MFPCLINFIIYQNYAKSQYVLPKVLLIALKCYIAAIQKRQENDDIMGKRGSRRYNLPPKTNKAGIVSDIQYRLFFFVQNIGLEKQFFYIRMFCIESYPITPLL